jgi:hypothetical protein
MNEPVDEDQIRAALPGIRIARYSELGDKLQFDMHGRLVLLFLTQDADSGHWVCLLCKENPKRIEFFDSYGLKPDEERKWLSQETLERLHDQRIVPLLKREQCIVTYNPYKLQRDSKQVQDCGKHCVIRLMHFDLNIDEYIDQVLQGAHNADEKVQALWEAIQN